MDQMVGEGGFQKPTDQAQHLPEAALQDIASAAKTSLLLTPDGFVPTQSFTNIKHRIDETFIKFVDRLKIALERQIESPEARKEGLNKMAMANANAKCKVILRSLPLETEPPIKQMVEACTKHACAENTVVQAVARELPKGCQEYSRQWLQKVTTGVLIVVTMDTF